jgi:hypothetical protein
MRRHTVRHAVRNTPGGTPQQSVALSLVIGRGLDDDSKFMGNVLVAFGVYRDYHNETIRRRRRERGERRERGRRESPVSVMLSSFIRENAKSTETIAVLSVSMKLSFP